MPIFVFGCDSCGHKQEEIFTMTTDKPPSACAKCGAKDPKKLPTTAGHRFRAADGVGGWEMNQHGSLQRTVKGKNSTHYGT